MEASNFVDRVFERLVEDVALLDIVSEEMLELAETDENCRAGGESANNCMSEEVHDKAEAQDTHDKLHASAVKGEARGEFDIFGRFHFGLGRERRFGHERHERDWTHGQLSAGAEQSVEEDGHDGGICMRYICMCM